MNCLRCDYTDENWFVQLPSVPSLDGYEYTVSQVQDDHTFFYLDLEKHIVSLNPQVKGEWLAGEICPEYTEFDLEFQISSDLVGSNTLSLPFCIHET